MARDISPAQTIQSWGDENYYSESKKLVFMIRLFMTSLKSMTSPSVINLRYIQAVYHVITDELSVTKEQAEELGGIQMYIKFADQDKSQWVPGFLENRLVEFVPMPLKNRQREDQWETAILRKAKSMSGDPVKMKEKYLELVSSNDHYGVTTFPCEQKDFSNLSPNVLVGVGDDGVSVWEGHTKKKMFHLAEILRWGYHPKQEFYIEVCLASWRLITRRPQDQYSLPV